MRLIINESQAEKLIDKIVFEQNMNIGRGGTDLRRAWHSVLSSKHGLPNGSDYENYTYIANIQDVIRESATNNIKTFLSVFRPYQAYDNKNKKAYKDYVNINGEELTQQDISKKVNKTFNFTEGTVIASHNGLLAIARAMAGLRGNPGKITLQFGTQTDVDAGKEERFTQGVVYQSSTTYEPINIINGLLSLISIVAVNPQNRQLTATYSNTTNWSDDVLYKRIEMYINTIIIGANLFFDPQNITPETVKNTLSDKGFITKLDFDIKPMFDALRNLRNMEDKINNKDYNQNKYEAISKISSQYIPSLLAAMKPVYVNNLKLFGVNFLPEYQNEILKSADTKVNFPKNLNLANNHKTQFTSRGASGTRVSGTLQTVNTNY